MNQETQKQFALKVFLASALACTAWYTLIKPVHERVESQRQTVESHTNLIKVYNDQVGIQDTENAIQIEHDLHEILDAMSASMDDQDSGTSLHTLLNSAAGNHGISISRIESVNAREVVQPIPMSEEMVKGVNHTVRVEFEGPYSSVMSFMNEVVTNPVPVAFAGLRVTPLGIESIRVNAEVNSVMLTEIPSDLAAANMSEGNNYE